MPCRSLLAALRVGGRANDRRRAATVLAALAARSTRRPVVVLVDDVHLADSGERALVDALIAMTQHHRLVVIGCADGVVQFRDDGWQRSGAALRRSLPARRRGNGTLDSQPRRRSRHCGGGYARTNCDRAGQSALRHRAGRRRAAGRFRGVAGSAKRPIRGRLRSVASVEERLRDSFGLQCGRRRVLWRLARRDRASAARQGGRCAAERLRPGAARRGTRRFGLVRLPANCRCAGRFMLRSSRSSGAFCTSASSNDCRASAPAIRALKCCWLATPRSSATTNSRPRPLLRRRTGCTTPRLSPRRRSFTFQPRRIARRGGTMDRAPTPRDSLLPQSRRLAQRRGRRSLADRAPGRQTRRADPIGRTRESFLRAAQRRKSGSGRR